MNRDILVAQGHREKKQRETKKKRGAMTMGGEQGIFSLTKLDTEKPSMIHQADMSWENSRGGTRRVIFSIGF